MHERRLEPITPEGIAFGDYDKHDGKPVTGFLSGFVVADIPRDDDIWDGRLRSVLRPLPGILLVGAGDGVRFQDIVRRCRAT